MKKSVVLFACFLAFTIATTTEQTILNLQKIGTEQFGKTIIDTVQLQLSANDSIQRITENLNKIASEIEEEQKEENELNSNQQQECKEDITRITSDIQKSQNLIDSLSSEISKNSPIAEQKLNLQTQKKIILQNLKESLVEMDLRYSAKIDETEQEKTEHEHAINILNQAKEEINIFFDGRSSFIEIRKSSSSMLTQVSMQFQEGTKQIQYKRKSWNSFFKVLSQIAATSRVQGDAGTVQKIKDIIEDLLQKIQESLSTELAEFQSFKSDYDDSRKNIVDQIATKQADIDKMKTEDLLLSQNIEQAKIENENEKARLSQKQQELNNKTTYCTGQQEYFEKNAQNRISQLETIHQVSTIVQNQLSTFKQYSQEKIN